MAQVVERQISPGAPCDRREQSGRSVSHAIGAAAVDLHLRGGGHVVAARNERVRQPGESPALVAVSATAFKRAPPGSGERRSPLGVPQGERCDRRGRVHPRRVGHVLPPKMYRLATSWQRPSPSTTEVAGSSPILAVPRRCQPVRDSAEPRRSAWPLRPAGTPLRAPHASATAGRSHPNTGRRASAPRGLLIPYIGAEEHPVVLIGEVLREIPRAPSVPSVPGRSRETITPEVRLAPRIVLNRRKWPARRRERPFRAAPESPALIRLIELHGVHLLTDRARPTTQRILEDPGDGAERVHHQLPADEPARIGQPFRMRGDAEENSSHGVPTALAATITTFARCRCCRLRTDVHDAGREAPGIGRDPDHVRSRHEPHTERDGPGPVGEIR